jgi:hypothetical protein
MSVDPNYVNNLLKIYGTEVSYNSSKNSCRTIDGFPEDLVGSRSPTVTKKNVALQKIVEEVKNSSEFKKYKESSEAKELTKIITSKLDIILKNKSYFSKLTYEEKHPGMAKILKENISKVLDYYLIIHFEKKVAKNLINSQKNSNNFSTNINKFNDEYKSINNQIRYAKDNVISILSNGLNSINDSLKSTNLISSDKEINKFLEHLKINHNVIAGSARFATEARTEIKKIVTEVHANEIDRQLKINSKLLECKITNKPNMITDSIHKTFANKSSKTNNKNIKDRYNEIKNDANKLVKRTENFISKLEQVKYILEYHNKFIKSFGGDHPKIISDGIQELNKRYEYIDKMIGSAINAVKDEGYLLKNSVLKLKITRDEGIFSEQEVLLNELKDSIKVLSFYDEKLKEFELIHHNIISYDNEEKIDNSIKKLQSLSINVTDTKKSESVINKKITKIRKNIENNLGNERFTSDGVGNQEDIVKKQYKSSLQFEAGIDDEDYTTEEFLGDLNIQYFDKWRECHENAVNASKMGDKDKSLKLLKDLETEMDKFEKFMVSGDVGQAGDLASPAHTERGKAADRLLEISEQL